MTLPRRQRRLVEAIDHQIDSADPRLASEFGTFGRLWAGEPLPDREQLRTGAGWFWPSLWAALGASAWAVLPPPEPAATPASGERGGELGAGAVAPRPPEWPPGLSTQRRRPRRG